MNSKLYYKVLHTITAIGFIVSVLFIFMISVNRNFSLDNWKNDQMVFGDKEAQVEILLFEDILCEECKNFTLHILPLVEKNYIQTKKAKLIYAPIEVLGNSDAVIGNCFCLYKQNPELAMQFLTQYFLSEDAIEKIKIKNALNGLDSDQSKEITKCVKNFSPQDFLLKNFFISQRLMDGDIEVPTIFVQGKKLEDVGYKTISKAIEDALIEINPNLKKTQ
jgi:protein-disulfide isomerase